MTNKITGKEYPLSVIFGDEFEYHIPEYQRPYAWTESETRDLFSDLYTFYDDKNEENYFLGSVVLIKEETKAPADVIDGQQRLTTLTILFSAIEYLAQNPNVKSSCRSFIRSASNLATGKEAIPRLFLRKRDQAYFEKYIQDGQLDQLISLNPASKEIDTEAKQHIQANCRLLVDCLHEKFENDEDGLLGFLRFLAQRCYLVSVSTPSQESAFRIFSVMNSRGMDLLPIDIIKSEVIGALPDSTRHIYADKWEELENMTGRDGFNEVFTHTRTIFVKERPKKNLLEEFRDYVVKIIPSEVLIDKYLASYAEAYVQLKSSSYSSTSYADEINQTLSWLNRTNNYDWMPPAIKFLADHPNDPKYFRWFIQRLERLASYLLATAQDLNQRFDRYKWILVEMENRPGNSLADPLRKIELTEWEKKQFLDALGQNIYLMTSQRRNYIIQRLDSFVSAGGASYNYDIFTVEHVLPQTPNQDSEWMKIWPDEEQRKYWLHRIANLVPLTRRKNSSAQNYDFAEKKEKYFQTKNGISAYALTTQVLNYESWTPQIVEHRQQELLDVFTKAWDLSPETETEDDRTFLLAGRGGDASGFPDGKGGFTVKKGSIVSYDVSDTMQSYKALREQLVNQGIINNRVFTVDYTFESPSAASAIILGRSSNGRREWRILDGRALASVGY